MRNSALPTAKALKPSATIVVALMRDSTPKPAKQDHCLRHDDHHQRP
jgi:hypothetical protein